jgi:hypothetical protein
MLKNNNVTDVQAIINYNKEFLVDGGINICKMFPDWGFFQGTKIPKTKKVIKRHLKL